MYVHFSSPFSFINNIIKFNINNKINNKIIYKIIFHPNGDIIKQIDIMVYNNIIIVNPKKIDNNLPNIKPYILYIIKKNNNSIIIIYNMANNNQ
jgi:hypothetical protein